MRIFIIITLACCTILPLSCKKQQRAEKQSLRINLSKDLQDDATNPNNPYDHVGYHHNEIIHSIRATWNQELSDRQQIYLSVSGLVDSTFMDSLHSFTIHDSINNYPVALLNNLGLSPSATSYAHDLLNLINGSDQLASYFEIKNTIINLEDDILIDNSLSTFEKQVLLSGTSVARYSFLYVIREENNLNSGSNVNPYEITASTSDSWNGLMSKEDVKRVARADAEGALYYTTTFGVYLASTGAAVFSAYEMHLMGYY